MSDATQGRFTPRCSPYQDRPLVPRTPDTVHDEQRAATREAVACEQRQPSPVIRIGVRTGRKQAGNFRRDHRAAYDQWRLRCAFLQRRFYDRDPRLPGGRALAGKTADDKLRAYIKGVRAGDWPTESETIAGLTVQVPKDPFTECWWGVNSRDVWVRGRRRTEEEAGDERLAGQPSAERPLWDALAAAHPATGWHPAECDRDPAEAWARRLSRRQARVAQVGMALRMGRRKERLRWLDHLLDTISRADDDPAFASLLLEWVCDQEPGYQLHCEAKLQRIHTRGRRARVQPVVAVVPPAEGDDAEEESKQAA